jgi:signal transduction histidine kinase
MEQQGGEIRIASRLGEGTRVTIELPVKEQRAE